MRLNNSGLVIVVLVVGTLIANIQAHAVPITGGTGPGGVGTTSGAGSGLQLWLRSDQGVTEAGGLVSDWADQSGHGNDVSSSGTNRPTFVSTSGTFNSQPVLNFETTAVNADRDFLSGTFSTVPGGTARTIFLISQAATLGNRTILDLGFGAPNSTGNYFLVTPEVAVRVTGNRVFDSALSTSTSSLLTLRNGTGADVSEIEAYEDGLALGETSSSAAALDTTGTATVIGARGDVASAATSYQGDIAETAIYNTELNNAERQIVQNSLGSKYGITITDDHYAGDTALNGDYDLDVFGIGREDATNILANTGSNGLGFEETGSSLSDGDYLLAGHKIESNALTSLGVPITAAVRMQRVWYIDRTDVDDGLTFDMAFDFSDAGITIDEFLSASILFSEDEPLNFVDLGIAPSLIDGDTITFSIPAGTLADGYYTIAVTVPVPEPSGLLLLGLGTLCMWRRVGRRRAKA